MYYILAVFNDGKARTLVSLTGTIEVFYEGKSHHKDNWPLPLFQERDYYNMSKQLHTSCFRAMLQYSSEFVAEGKLSSRFFVLFFHPFITTGYKERLAERGGVCSFGEACSDWFAAVTDSDQ